MAESQRIRVTSEAALNATATLGSVLVFTGRMDEGWQLLQDAIARARVHAAGGGGSTRIPPDRIGCVTALMEYDRAERWLTEGIRYAEQAELWNHRHFMASHLAHVQWRHRPVGRGRPDRTAGAHRRARRHHHPDHRAVRPGLPGDGARLTGKPPTTPAARRRSSRASRWPSCRGCHRRCGGWPKPRAVRTRRRAERSVSAATTPRPTSRTPPTFSPTCSPGCGLYLAHGDVDAAGNWSEPGRRGACRPRHPRHPARDQPRPGTGPARTRRGIRSRPGAGIGERVMAGPAPVLGRHLGPVDLAQAAARARRRGEAAVLLDEARTIAATADATTLVDAADRLAASFDQRGRPSRGIR